MVFLDESFWKKTNEDNDENIEKVKQQKIKHTCLANTAISSLNDSDEQTSPPVTPGSLGVQVANSHFSNINANNGNNGCLFFFAIV